MKLTSILRSGYFKVILTAICFSVYSGLAWHRIIPSIFHYPPVRSIWDKTFAACEKQIGLETKMDFPNQLYVTFFLHGRLGNWMFAYASLLGIAKRNKRIPYVLRDRNVLQYVFNVKHTRDHAADCVRQFIEYRPATYDPLTEELPQKNLTLESYFQSWRYFHDIQDEIRQEFTFHIEIMRRSEKILTSYISQNSLNTIKSLSEYFTNSSTILIGVHVRRADMTHDKGFTYIGFRSATLEYIHNAIAYMRSKFADKNIKFVVVSDDYWWCYDNLKKVENVIIIPRNDRAIDMAILTLCNHTIMTTGTFGWWGAWLAGGHTVYYRDYPIKGTRLDRDTNKADFYPPDWVALDSAKHLKSNIWLYLFTLLIFNFCTVLL